jgi:hypothetical protein
MASTYNITSTISATPLTNPEDWVIKLEKDTKNVFKKFYDFSNRRKANLFYEEIRDKYAKSQVRFFDSITRLNGYYIAERSEMGIAVRNNTKAILEKSIYHEFLHERMAKKTDLEFDSEQTKIDNLIKSDRFRHMDQHQRMSEHLKILEAPKFSQRMNYHFLKNFHLSPRLNESYMRLYSKDHFISTIVEENIANAFATFAMTQKPTGVKEIDREFKKIYNSMRRAGFKGQYDGATLLTPYIKRDTPLNITIEQMKNNKLIKKSNITDFSMNAEEYNDIFYNFNNNLQKEFKNDSRYKMPDRINNESHITEYQKQKNDFLKKLGGDINGDIDIAPPVYSQKIRAMMPSEINQIREDIDRWRMTPQHMEDSARVKDLFKNSNMSGIKSKIAKLARFFANFHK